MAADKVNARAETGAGGDLEIYCVHICSFRQPANTSQCTADHFQVNQELS
jgi:hypothetical protein